MKKRNILTMALCMLLTFAIGVGGTLAYLSDTDDAVKNTFEFANNIVVFLKEPQPEQGEGTVETTEGGEQTGWKYSDIVPGQSLDKQPTFDVTTEFPTWVFAKVTGANATIKVDTTTLNQNWAPLEGTTDEYGNGVYYYDVTAAQEASENEDSLGALFTKVIVANDATAEAASEVEIEIQVSAIQKQGFDGVEAAYTEAAKLFQ